MMAEPNPDRLAEFGFTAAQVAEFLDKRFGPDCSAPDILFSQVADLATKRGLVKAARKTIRGLNEEPGHLPLADYRVLNWMIATELRDGLTPPQQLEQLDQLTAELG